jgi:hypothetical protein
VFSGVGSKIYDRTSAAPSATRIMIMKIFRVDEFIIIVYYDCRVDVRIAAGFRYFPISGSCKTQTKMHNNRGFTDTVNIVPDRLMVGQRFLVPLIVVRVHVGQQFENTRLACFQIVARRMPTAWHSSWTRGRGDVYEA